MRNRLTLTSRGFFFSPIAELSLFLFFLDDILNNYNRDTITDTYRYL